ncbi:hypothetical protein L210DRAFT_3668451 [Boletus edulis BED1]|uniref:DNA-directed DNA polymerase n=1 Tax=Boletus edulis BED1 TaxID=1328754 RepID=A0AAD4BE88_BOLED|nr:hypothetical protein L210DRAFT_3668451 [Boletus edulis BED1]
MADDGKNGAEDVLEEDGAHQPDHQGTRNAQMTPNPLEGKEDSSLAKNPFTIAWNQLVESRQKRSRSRSVNINDTSTPAKLRKHADQQISVHDVFTTPGFANEAEPDFLRRLPNPGRRTTPNLHLNPRIFAFAPPPPSASEFLSIIEQFGLPRRIYRDPFYSKKVDVPDGPREYAGRVYRLKGRGLDALEEWQASESHISSAPKARAFLYHVVDGSMRALPLVSERSQDGRKRTPMDGSPCQRSIPNYHTRGPTHDSVLDGSLWLLDQGILVVHSPQLNPHRLHDYSLEVFSDELGLINRIIDIIVNVDPDILVGWEVQATPWGYISFRGSQYGHWPTCVQCLENMRSEQTLGSYTFENVAFHLLRKSESPVHTARACTVTITAMNPAPIKLKFEKVRRWGKLMAKKRYVGFKYETPDETEPTFDAKDIETVRRDGVPAQAKMAETCFKILFRTQNLSENLLQDFIFAKEVRMGTYSDKVPPLPGVAVAARRILQNENDEPQYGECVPYVIVRGDPHTHCSWREPLRQKSFWRTERIFNLVGVDVRAWYDEMPKTITVDEQDPLAHSPRKRAPVHANQFKIDEHFQSAHCLTCSCTARDDKLDPVCWTDTAVLL